MKKQYILIAGTLVAIVGSISTIVFAADLLGNTTSTIPAKSPDLRQDIADKLEQYSRMQNALDSIQQLDSKDFVDTGFSTKDAATKIISLGEDIDNVVSDIEKIQEKRNENNENYQETLKQVKRIIIDIKTTKQTITNSVTKVNLYTQRMIDTISRLDETRKYLYNTRDTLGKLLPALFMIQNAYTNQAGSIDDLKLLLGDQENITTTLTFDDMVQGLSAKLDTILGELTDAQTRYTQTFKDMYETRKQIKQATLTYRQKIGILEEQRAYLLDFVALYKNNKIKLDNKITNIFETRSQLKQRTEIIVQKIKNTLESKEIESIPSYQEFMNKKDDRENRPNMFSRPVLPVQTINTLFGDTIKAGDQDEAFQGIQIEANQGQEIYAPADGLVYYAQDQDGIGVNWMVILHKNGYISVFTNVQKALVKTSDIVDRGQLIGLVGGQPGTRGAGWFSNGSMVNMQVFKNGKAIDPLQLMDLSVIKNSSILPDKYQVKYDTDSRLRNTAIDMSTVKFMEGNTTRERRAKFLDTVAAGPYNDIMLWESAAEGTHVDVDLGICIGYAETSMGRHFASDNNVGNVGNNDRGDRVDKSSPLDGAKAIYNVLNNQYLGKYRTIYELSGYGNKDGSIYASSEYNWQKNVSRCLSTIKGYIIPEDFPFRTYSEFAQ